MKPFGKEHTRRSALFLHEQGIEMTPDQVTEERRKAYKTIRAEMRKHGLTVPDDDVELFKMIRKAHEQEGKP